MSYVVQYLQLKKRIRCILYFLFAPGRYAKYCDLRVCLSAFENLCVYLTKFSVHVNLWSWLGPRLTTVELSLFTSHELN